MRPLRCAALAALAALALTPVIRSAASAATPPPQPREHEVKAAFLYHFAQLVDWPETAGGPGDPFVIAVAGPDPFGGALEPLAAKAVRSRPIQIKRPPNAAAIDPRAVHLLFVAGSRENVERSLAAVAGHPVLTVGEAEGFAERGGMIGFRVTPEGRVTFDINLRRAERAGLRMRSQLLKLARIVGER